MTVGMQDDGSAKHILAQEPRIKHFRQQLEYVLGKFYAVLKQLDPAVRPLLSQHIEAVMRLGCEGVRGVLAVFWWRITV